ncbi:MAG: DUF1572 family protein [Acidobacteria bacterium]|nr:DUF1572 family protein [Acidobacteriota bacterium]
MNNIANNFLADAIRSFHSYKKLAERALEQISDEEFFVQIDSESNSLALIVKHIAGNLRSRWTDFLTTDGEKPDRHRDTEFELIGDTRHSLMQFWEHGWETLFSTLDTLSAQTLEQKVTIRGEPHTVVEAINRQLTHYSYHVGQIVFLAKHLKASDWRTLSVPRNRSAEFNVYLNELVSEGSLSESRLDVSAKFASGSERSDS